MKTSEIRAFAKRYYADKDTMHDLSHITRVFRKAIKIGSAIEHAAPHTIEGKILHDAHLLEGDDFFLVTKCLVTGSARGQSLAETVRYLKKNVIGKAKCCLPANRPALKRRELIAKKFIKSIEPEL